MFKLKSVLCLALIIILGVIIALFVSFYYEHSFQTTFYVKLLFLSVGLLLLLLVYIAYIQRYNAKKLYKAAYFDEVTGLPNLLKFKEDIAKILQENPSSKFTIIKLDIIRFKMINEIFSYDIGDEVIQSVANILKAIHTEFWYAARITSDEFVVFDLSQNIHEIAVKKNAYTDYPVEDIDKIKKYKIKFCQGRYFFKASEIDINTALENVNLAHRIAKSQKHSNIYDFNERVKRQVVEEVAFENKMEEALNNNEFLVYLQAKYWLSNEKIAGAEALVRWINEGEAIAYPDQFIPVFEKNGFILKLDMYMLEKVCEIISELLEDGIVPFTISVNFSKLHLFDEDFVDNIEKIVNKYNIPKNYIEIELTESTIFENEKLFQEVLNKLHLAGYTLSMDDFGKGYSSLGLLKNLAVDCIKIDRSFFSCGKQKDRERIVLESIIEMAKKLKVSTVAEGVEIKEHIDMLREVGCDVVQGYYYAKPIYYKDFILKNNIMD